MDFRQAIKETMFRFNIKGVDLADKAGVKRTQISAFRTGKRDLYVSTLEQILNAMPREAQAYFYELLHRCTVNPQPKLEVATKIQLEKGSTSKKDER